MPQIGRLICTGLGIWRNVRLLVSPIVTHEHYFTDILQQRQCLASNQLYVQLMKYLLTHTKILQNGRSNTNTSIWPRPLMVGRANIIPNANEQLQENFRSSTSKRVTLVQLQQLTLLATKSTGTRTRIHAGNNASENLRLQPKMVLPSEFYSTITRIPCTGINVVFVFFNHDVQ